MDWSFIDSTILALVLIAYFIKGFSGFGPALILIPVIAIFYDPHTALLMSSFLDFIAGPLLLIPVIRRIDWKFVIPVTLLLFLGAYIGVSFLTALSPNILKKIIAVVLLIFITFLVLQKERSSLVVNKRFNRLRYPVSLLAGLSGGVTGISGPPLALFLKLTTKKDYFRTQLIAVFTFGSFWRFFWYQQSGLVFSINKSYLVLFVISMLIGLWLGNKFQIKASETTFNRVIALILLIPVLNIWLF